MLKKRRFLGSSGIQPQYNFTIVSEVRKILQLKKDDPVNFLVTPDNSKVYLTPMRVKIANLDVYGSNLTSGNFVTIPLHLRNRLGIRPGHNVLFYYEEDEDIIVLDIQE